MQLVSPLHNHVKFLKDNDTYVVAQGNKNLGPYILECKLYIYKAFEQHLDNGTNYKSLRAVAGRGRQRGLQYLFRD